MHTTAGKPASTDITFVDEVLDARGNLASAFRDMVQYFSIIPDIGSEVFLNLRSMHGQINELYLTIANPCRIIPLLELRNRISEGYSMIR